MVVTLVPDSATPATTTRSSASSLSPSQTREGVATSGSSDRPSTPQVPSSVGASASKRQTEARNVLTPARSKNPAM